MVDNIRLLTAAGQAGTSPEVRLDGVPGGDGPAFGEGFYIVTRDNEGYPGSVIIEQR
jgi:hypothetical protein